MLNPDEKSRRMIEAASAVLHAAPGHSLNVVVLNKILFYVDLVSLRDIGDTVTRNSFIALQNGPVIAQYPKRLVAALEEKGIARQESRWDAAKPMVLVQCPKHFDFIDSNSMIMISDVTSFFADSTSAAASEYSHRNPGWKIAWNQFQREGKPVAINMRIALQQIIESDPWMARPLINDDEILAAADAGLGDDW